MPKRDYSSNLQEHSPKRFKVAQDIHSPAEPQGSMTSNPGPGIQLQLTETEAKLRQLLLDVASYIDQAPAQEETSNVQIPKELLGEKIVLRWTGGWVRDKLLRVGSHDIDLAINKMTGEHFGLKMQEYLEIPGNAEKHGLVSTEEKSNPDAKSKKIAPGLHKIEANPEKSKNLETATTKIMGIDLDLVNLRKETYNEVSRNPQMEFGTAEEDAMRRDATVNAMFYNLHSCQVEDFTKRGHEDMAARIIRTPLEPSQTFKDDPLRILRLIRFASRLDYSIDSATANAMADPGIQEVLKIKISRERVGIELEKMLRGPRPRTALELIDRFALYKTVFTDPTRQLPCEPQTHLFRPAYEFIDSLLAQDAEVPASVPKTLVRDGEEAYLAWICAAMMPWADAPTVPHAKPTQRPFFTAYLVAREGFKAPNKVCDVIAASLSNSEDIRKLIAQCAKNLRRPDTVISQQDATARDILGMAIRRWGSTWRTQILFNLTYEIVLGQISRQDLLRSYSDFLACVAELGILDADTFKPLVKGTDLAKALHTKPGPWMKDALDVVMAWQLRNPQSKDAAAAIEAVRAAGLEKTNSELPSCLASHFVQLTIPPLFPQSSAKTNGLEKSYQASPWKEAATGYALDLLRWSIAAMSVREMETQWRYLMPPILRMIDDVDVGWKTKGCALLHSLLECLQQDDDKSSSPAGKSGSRFLYRAGYHDIFANTLFPLFTYLPSLTPESESVILLQEVFNCVHMLALLAPRNSDDANAKGEYLDKTMRTGIIAALGQMPTPSTYPSLATLIMGRASEVVHEMGIRSVKHAAPLVSLACAILQEPFALSHSRLVIVSLKALQTIMLNAWPRMSEHRGLMMMGLSVCWETCTEERTRPGDVSVEEVQKVLRETVAMLDAVMAAVDDDAVRAEWAREKHDLMGASAAMRDLLGWSETEKRDGS